MNKYLSLLTNKVYELYRAFEDHAFNSYVSGKNNYKIVINFKPNNTIHLVLFKGEYDKQKVDEVYLSFDNERKLYEALSLRLFALILGNVQIYKLDNNMYHNPKHKPYSLVIIDDQVINTTVKSILENNENRVSLDNEVINNISKKIKYLKPEWSFLSLIEDRTAITKELLRKW